MHKSNIFNRYLITDYVTRFGNSNADLMALRKFYNIDYGWFRLYPLINYPDEIKVDNAQE